MKYWTTAAAAALVGFALAPAMAGPTAVQMPGARGALSSDGTFHPLVQRHALSTRKATTLTGTLTAAIPFTIVSQIGKKLPVLCTLYVEVFNTSTDPNVSDFIETTETVQAPATLSGSTGTCSLKLPFQWQLSDAKHDSLVLDLTINTPMSAAYLPADGNADLFENGVGAKAKLPANNATTDLSAKFPNLPL
jgi:hypothetical protein